MPKSRTRAVTEAHEVIRGSNVEHRPFAGRQEEKARGADPKVVAALTAALKDGDKDVRETAMHALVQMRDPAMFDPLIQALKDQNPGVREQAAFGFGQLRTGAPSLHLRTR